MDFIYRKDDLNKEDLISLQKEGSFSVDLETTGLDPKSSGIRLCQIHSNFTKKSFLVKTQENSLPPINIKKLLLYADEVIFHHAMFDMKFLHLHWKLTVTNPKCTKIASKIILSTRKNHSLKPLLKDLLGIKISKEQQKSNWDSENLTDAQIKYALHDVLHLRALLKEIETRASDEELFLVKNSYNYINTRLHLDMKGLDDVFTY